MDLSRTTLRAARGQATSEYVALVALVAVVLTLAAGLTSGGLGGELLAGLRRGLCRVTGGVCARPPVAGTDRLAPCPLSRSFRVEELTGAIAFVRLGSNEMLSAVRGSDGRVTVMLADGSSAGGELRAGASVGVGVRSFGGSVHSGAGSTWTSGRAWTFSDARAARSFVAAYGAKATVGGRLVDELRSRCSLLCDALGWRPHPRLPEPDERYEEGGTTGALKAAFGLGGSAPLVLGAESGRVIGRRIRGDGSTTWYLRLTDSETAALELPGARRSHSKANRTVVSYALDPDGRPTTLDVLRTRETRADVESAAAGDVDLGAGGGSGELVELEATLDLHDRANRAAAAGLLAALRGDGSLETLARRTRTLDARIARFGQLDRRRYAVTRSVSGADATVGLGLQLGAGFERSTRGLRLLSAETRLPGLPFLPRDDCRPA